MLEKLNNLPSNLEEYFIIIHIAASDWNKISKDIASVNSRRIEPEKSLKQKNSTHTAKLTIIGFWMP